MADVKNTEAASQPREGDGEYVAGPIWAEPEDECFTAEVQIVGGHYVVATVHGSTRDEAEQRQRAIIAALTQRPPEQAGAVRAGVGKAEMRCRLQDVLQAEFGDTYDCTRVWSAWGYSTMDENDFVPVLDRMDQIIDGLVDALSAAPTPPDAGPGEIPAGMDRFANDAAAKALYDTWSDQPGWVPWVDRGNSIMQERARREVML